MFSLVPRTICKQKRLVRCRQITLEASFECFERTLSLLEIRLHCQSPCTHRGRRKVVTCLISCNGRPALRLPVLPTSPRRSARSLFLRDQCLSSSTSSLRYSGTSPLAPSPAHRQPHHHLQHQRGVDAGHEVIEQDAPAVRLGLEAVGGPGFDDVEDAEEQERAGEREAGVEP